MNDIEDNFVFNENDRLVQNSPKISRIMKAYFKLQYLLRTRTKLYICYYLVGLLMVFSSLSLSLEQTANSTFQLKQDLPNYSMSLYNTRSLFNSSLSELFVSSNNIPFAQNFTSLFFETQNVNFVSNISEIQYNMNYYSGNATILFGLDIDYTLINSSTPNYSIASITSTMYPKYTSETFINAFSQFFITEKNTNFTISIDTKPYQYVPKAVNISKASAGALYFIMGHLFIHVGSVYIYSRQNQQKLLFLLEINGISNKIGFFFTILLCIIEHLPVNLLATRLFCSSSDLSNGTDASLFFFSEYMFTITIFSIQIFFQPLLHSTGIVSFYTGILLFVFILFELAIILEYYVSTDVYKFLLCILGPTSYIKMCDFMIQKKNENGILSWSNLDYSINNISARFVLISQVINAIVSLFISWLGHISNRNCYGKPPLGWDNFFNLKMWKKLFSKDESIIVNQRSNETIPDEINIETPSIEFDNVTKEYIGFQINTIALDNVSLKVSPGELIVAIGPNGSGKSTLISSIIGEINIKSGIIKLYGRQIFNDFDQLMYPILGVAFQENVLFDKLTTKEHFELFGSLFDYSDYVLYEKMNYFMDALKIKEYENTLAENLSGGTKRKLCVSIALFKDPAIIILDEPTAGVDLQSRQLIWHLVSAYRHSTRFITTHSVQESESLSSRLLVLSKGQIAFIGTPSELREKYNCCYYLSIINEGCVDMENILDCVNQIPGMEGRIRMHPDHPYTLMIPNNLFVADVLQYIETNKEMLGIENYTIRVENIEETMKKMIENDEATNNRIY